MIAALFVQADGCYSNLPDVDLWPIERDAMKYDGPYRVVAHPPCSRWCQLAGLVQARWGHKLGDDGGTFAHALDCVRRFGGVLEHPAYSHAWAAHGLNPPPPTQAWVNADFEGGWTCHVEQGAYGHAARKATWLYAHSVPLPQLEQATRSDYAWVSYCDNNSFGQVRQRLTKKQAAATPERFRNLLLSMARG